MTRKDWNIILISGIVLGLLATAGINVGLQATAAKASQSEEMNEILTLILNSHNQWATVSGAAKITWYSPDGSTQSYTQAFSISQPGSARFETIEASVQVNPEVWISDGSQVYEVDTEQKTYTTSVIPAFIYDTGMIPKTPDEVQNDVIYPFPFSLLIPSPVAEYVFPHWFAQGSDKAIYKLLGEDSILDRNVWVVQLLSNNDEVSAWIDKETGVILRYEQQTDGKPFVSAEITSITFDGQIDASEFSAPIDFDQVSNP